MDKAQTLHSFWSGFGLPAYDQTTVPIGDNAPDFPYLTYDMAYDSMDDAGNALGLSASIWYHGGSWAAAEAKAAQIAEATKNAAPMACDNGWIWIRQGRPFAQRIADPNDDMIRRIRIVIDVKYLTTY